MRTVGEAQVRVEGMERCGEMLERLYGGLDGERRERLRMAQALFMLAHDCYAFAHDRFERKSDNRIVLYCGAVAGQYVAAFAAFGERIGKDEGATLETLERISAHMVGRGWRGLPSYDDERGVAVDKTAQGMHRDMLAYREAGMRLIASMKAAQ